MNGIGCCFCMLCEMSLIMVGDKIDWLLLSFAFCFLSVCLFCSFCFVVGVLSCYADEMQYMNTEESTAGGKLQRNSGCCRK